MSEIAAYGRLVMGCRTLRREGGRRNGTAVPDLPEERRCCLQRSVAVPRGVPACISLPDTRMCALDAGRDRLHRLGPFGPPGRHMCTGRRIPTDHIGPGPPSSRRTLAARW
jgi:hypothetical protein